MVLGKGIVHSMPYYVLLKTALDNRISTGATFVDLSKAFDCLNHDLLIAKLEAYGFTRKALNFIYSVLNSRKQRVKINGSYSEWKNINHGVPQGSVLRPFLFNIYINDLFMFVSYSIVCNYADDTTIYVRDHMHNKTIRKLENDITILSKWFRDNYTKLNRDKCHLMFFSSIKNINLSIKIDNEVIAESSEEKLLGIILDKTLSFKSQVTSLYKRAKQKLHALSRIAKYMDTVKLKQVMKVFILSQFNYCPLIWMFCERRFNNKINHLHEMTLRIAYKDDNSDFTTFLEKDNAVKIHTKNLQLLMTEIYKTHNNLNPVFMEDIFNAKCPQYSLRNGSKMNLPKIRTTTFGIETISYVGGKLWHKLSTEIKESSNFAQFRTRIKTMESRRMLLQIM